MSESLFHKVAFSLNVIKLKTSSRLFLNEFCKIFKNSFFTGHLRGLLLIFRKLDTQTFSPIQICSLDHYCWQAIFEVET